jgi:hypothetical protein
MRSSRCISEKINPEPFKWQLGFAKELMKYAQLDTAVQYYLTELYVKLDDDTDLLLKYLNISPSNLFGLQLALRTCLSRPHFYLSLCTWIYVSLELHEDAIDLALTFDITLAKNYASLPEIPMGIKK